jgi:hypothetical protein
MNTKIISVQRPDGTHFTINVPEDTRIEVDNTILIWSLKRGYHKPIAVFPITYAVTYGLVDN